MYTLYGSRGSGSAAVEVALRCCKLPYRVVRASTWEPESALEELGHVNPLRQIPTLVLPDGSVLSESAAILIHLGLVDSSHSLLPAEVGARHQLHRHWEIFADMFPATPYLGGKHLGALDILAAVVSKWSGTRAHLKKHRPQFMAALLRIEAHESVAPVFGEHWSA